MLCSEKLNINLNSTIDSKHTLISSNFEKEKEKIPKLKEELEKLESQLKEIDLELENKKSHLAKINKFKLSKKINNLKQQIKRLENDEDELDYYIKVHPILTQYKTDYKEKNKKNTIANILFNKNGKKENKFVLNDDVIEEIHEKEMKRIEEKEKEKKIEDATKKSPFLKALNSSPYSGPTSQPFNLDDGFSLEPSITDDSLEKLIENDDEKSKKSNLEDFLDIIEDSNNEELNDKFMKRIDSTYIGKTKGLSSKCEKCNVEIKKIIADGFYLCPYCGKTVKIIVDSEKPNFREPVQDNNNFLYKRKNHFNELLNQIQGKESTEIPQSVLNKIKREIRKNKIKRMDLIDYEMMRNILKNLELNKYYEHIIHIIHRITGTQPPVIPMHVEETLSNMFDKVQKPFAKVCPSDRKNFLNYFFLFYKMCELKEYDYLLPYFPLFKSDDKLYEQDQIWKNICKELKWQFIPSV